ncbi:MAG: cbb3-type cytochrome oxidase assembly protein CcoS [Flammeovirgaceae bacterium]|nr:cbb3-type cytochrome oxidase assembly protein CcoS [Flammeovirgaceae bacterium]
MNIIVALIAISLSLALFFLGLFIWSLKSGQFDDPFGPAARMLFDEKREIDQYKKNSLPSEMSRL